MACLAQGDQQALARVYDLTVSRVYGLALRITGKAEAAEEVAKNVSLQAWRTPRDYGAAHGKVIARLLIICRSRAIDPLRRQDIAQRTPLERQRLTLAFFPGPYPRGDSPAQQAAPGAA